MRAVVCGLAVLASACGGGNEQARSVRQTPDGQALAAAPKTYAIENYVYRPPPSAVTAQSTDKPAAAAPATSEDAAFTVEDESGAKHSSFDLEPIRGRGYPELKILLTARKLGDPAPASPVRPVCKAQACEYPLSKTYSVSVSDPKLVRLVPRDDAVMLVASTLSVGEVPKAVDVLLSAGEQVIGRRRVILLGE
jgi:hypothetical protein